MLLRFNRTRYTIHNLKTAIKAAGGELDDILALRLYIVERTSVF